MKTYLGLGSNLGDKKGNIDQAIRKIATVTGEVICRSDYYVSAPWRFESEHDFVNVVICVETALQPLELLHQLQRIEQEMGRDHKSVDGVYADRIIDIDILLYDDLVIDLPELKVPHPHMKERDFVMKPLNEILG
ncbi:MAG: 2-amino-4-hydroxy-6-hydroxymethyldihydropteridine diphosphokinase [Paludibacter sp.]|nr:2-amino-4-hydroxy-6-hydroxymethyldihydropteridine diphosphokinase [Paludibacter sp.]MDD4198944.1 2-amino-4-hydroxy-6-hydroxymethyldihydropteridine diphosphokinase [Paludibacter sp.]MDD4427205.1 2-amino-4-hydroxy-6-hydroxymethyldihydropteridine diphosphokinase [Paludibacter sp.]